MERISKKHEMTRLLNVILLSKDQDYAIEQFEKRSFDWKHFLDFLVRNKVTVRTLQRLREQGEKLPEDAERMLSNAEQKKKQKLQVLRMVDTLFAENEIKYILMKFIESWPDLGRDTDCFVGNKIKRAEKLVQSNFPAREIPLSLSDRLTNSKSSFFIGEVELELYGKITQLGEHYFAGSKIIERAANVAVDGLRIPVPSFEDGLLITCVHCMYRHRRIKYSEILVAAKAICTDNVDWEYVFQNASKAGILHGLAFFLSTARALLNQYTSQTKNMQSEQLSWTRSFPAAVPTSRVSQFYGRKFLNEIGSLRLSSASHVGAIPFLGIIAELSQKLKLGFRIW
ncbi:MAG: nucleotidyltransferase family protein [Candidatus Bathyarchaeota archaeon]|jgi:hypothetical protein